MDTPEKAYHYRIFPVFRIGGDGVNFYFIERSTYRSVNGTQQMYREGKYITEKQYNSVIKPIFEDLFKEDK